jgi:ParB family chromosome partitioning protein
MSESSLDAFTAALRAELDAVVARYQALSRAREEALELAQRARAEALRAELAEARAALEKLRAEESARKAELGELKAKVEELGRALSEAQGRAETLEAQARAASAVSQALSEQFAAEQRFVAACGGLGGSLLEEALKGAVGRDLEAAPATYAALKERGLSGVLVSALKERGRSAGHAPLLSRERGALGAIAAAAGCELIMPEAGARFAVGSMEKAGTVVEPAEEGNVVECLMPGCRRIGTEGALLFPRVVVATG